MSHFATVINGKEYDCILSPSYRIAAFFNAINNYAETFKEIDPEFNRGLNTAKEIAEIWFRNELEAMGGKDNEL